MKLKEKWNAVCDEYAALFAEIIGLDLDYWISDEPGKIAVYGDYFVDISDIRYMVDNKINGDLFFEWYDYSQDVYELCEGRKVSIRQYIEDNQRPYTQEQLDKIRGLQREVEKIKEDLEKEIKNIIDNHA